MRLLQNPGSTSAITRGDVVTDDMRLPHNVYVFHHRRYEVVPYFPFSPLNGQTDDMRLPPLFGLPSQVIYEENTTIYYIYFFQKLLILYNTLSCSGNRVEIKGFFSTGRSPDRGEKNDGEGRKNTLSRCSKGGKIGEKQKMCPTWSWGAASPLMRKKLN